MSRKLKNTLIFLLVSIFLWVPKFAQASQLSESLEAVSNVSHEGVYHPLEGNLSREDLSSGYPDNALSADIGGLKIEVPKNPGFPVSIEDSEAKTLINFPVDENASSAQLVGESVVGFEGGNYDSYASLKGTGDIQFSTVIKNHDAPVEYIYEFTLGDGESFSKLEDYIVVVDSQGEISAVFDKPWAKDGMGKDVPTFFEVRGDYLVQHVDHLSGEYSYPIVADPVYSRGIIGKVLTERWTPQGYWHVALHVTLKARVMWGQGQWAKVYVDGLAELREHHPRSMASHTMSQQWECHVVGLPMTYTIDLESFRPSYPQWRSRIPTLQRIVREGRGSVANTCNW